VSNIAGRSLLLNSVASHWLRLHAIVDSHWLRLLHSDTDCKLKGEIISRELVVILCTFSKSHKT